MANTSTQSLRGRIAAVKPPVSTKKAELQVRSGAAWALAKSMLPGAPYDVQMRYATAQMALPTKVMVAALKQTAVNAHYTHVATALEAVHKCDLNDLLEDPSILTKERNAVESELKGEAKNAGAKTADDRKDAGPLPDAYPEVKRNEPKELDGSNAGKRPPVEKESAAKKAHGKDCKGCPDCETDKKDKKDKAAAVKKAEDEKPPMEGAAPEDGPEDTVDDMGDDSPEQIAAQDEADAAIDDDLLGEVDEIGSDEPFDEPKALLEDKVDDLKSDIEELEDVVADFSADTEDITFDDEADLDLEGDDMPEELGDLNEDGEDVGLEGDEPADGEELDISSIFDQDNMSDKVSALNDEDVVVLEENDGDDFFAPSDASELESILEQEEGLSSAADMFSLHGVDDDPLARIFASAGKRAAEETIIEPGDIDSHFDSDIKGETRDAMVDHDGDIFSDVYEKLKQPTRDDNRDTKPNLETPKAARAGKAAAAVQPKGVRRITQTATDKRVGAGVSLASLLMGDDM